MKRLISISLYLLNGISEYILRYKEYKARRFVSNKLGYHGFKRLETGIRGNYIILPNGFIGFKQTLERFGRTQRGINLIIFGYSQSGKTYIGKALCNYLDIEYTNTTKRMIETIGFRLPEHSNIKPKNRRERKFLVERAYAARDGYRVELAKRLKEYNGQDCCKLMRVILSKHNIYIGPRRDVEVETIKKEKAARALCIFIRNNNCVKREADDISEKTADIVFDNSSYNVYNIPEIITLQDIVGAIDDCYSEPSFSYMRG